MDSNKETIGRIQSFPSAQILVLGDMFLDIYLECRALGVANEAPVPLLEVSGETSFPGGAANVALNLARLGVQTQLIGMVGKDTEARTLSELLTKAGVGFHAIEAPRPTIRKTRFLSRGHYYLRVDEEETIPIATDQVQLMLEAAREVLPQSALVVISDYDKGLFTSASVEALEKLLAGSKVKVLADVKPQNLALWQHLDLITPNLAEARAIHSNTGNSDKKQVSETQLAEDLNRRLKCDVVLKLGQDGMIAASQGHCLARIPAPCAAVRNSSGAGDSVLSTLAATLACGGSLGEAARLAALAASIAVSHEETYAVSSDELIRAIAESRG